MNLNPFKSNLFRGYSPNWATAVIPQFVLFAFFLVSWKFPDFNFAGIFSRDLWLWLAASDIGWPLLSWALLMWSLLAELCFAQTYLQEKVSAMGPALRSVDIESGVKEVEAARGLVLKWSRRLVIYPTALIGGGSVIAAVSMSLQQLPGITFEPLICLALVVAVLAYAFIDDLSTRLAIEQLPAELDWVARVVDAWKRGHLRNDGVSKDLVIRAHEVLETYFSRLEGYTTEQGAELESSVDNILAELRVTPPPPQVNKNS